MTFAENYILELISIHAKIILALFAIIMSPIPSLHHKFRFDTQSTHRVAMATFWRTFNPNGKISPAWCSWGLPRPSPFTLSIQSTSKVVVYAPVERADTLPPVSPLPLYVLCGSTPRSPSVQLKGQ